MQHMKSNRKQIKNQRTVETNVDRLHPFAIAALKSLLNHSSFVSRIILLYSAPI